MTLLCNLIIMIVFTTVLISGCRIQLPADKPFVAIELAQQNKSKAETVVSLPLTATDKPRPRRVKGTSKTTTTEQMVAKTRLSYTVCAGDLLWSIAKRPDIYGDPLLWFLLYQANRDQIKDPRKIYAGQTLSIPRNSSDAEREDARNQAKNPNFFPQVNL